MKRIIQANIDRFNNALLEIETNQTMKTTLLRLLAEQKEKLREAKAMPSSAKTLLIGKITSFANV
jgi:hypothetical protein